MAGRYKAYPAYKDSGVEWLGEIPEGWKTVPIGRYFRRIKRTNFPYEELLSVYRDYGVIPKSSRDDNNNKESEDLSPYQLVCKNDLVMNKMKAWQGSIAISEYKGIVSPAYFVYIPLEKLKRESFFKYIHYLVRLPLYASQYLRMSKGIRVNQWDLDPEQFENIELLLPKQPEQQTIAQFLDYETAKIDALIAKQEQLIALLKEKRQAVISHAVTKGLNPDAPMKASGVEWLGQVPEHWEVVAVRNVTKFVSTGSTPKREESFTETEEVNWFTPGDFLSHFILIDSEKYISRDSVIKGDAKLYPANSVVIIGIGATLGKVAVINKEFSCNQQINVVVPNEKIESHFLAYSLLAQKEQMQLSSNSSTIGIMNQDKTKSLKILAPPINEQLKIINFIGNELEKFDSLESKVLGLNLLLQERKTALISAAVTGKIDVRDWQPPRADESRDY